MDINLTLEKRNADVFNVSVIQEANRQAEKMLEDAKKKSKAAIDEAYLSCEQADKEKITAALQESSAREYSALVLENRQQLLGFRKQLVDGLFRDVEKKAEEFAAGDRYGAWLASCLSAYAAKRPGAALTVHLRHADSRYEKLLEKAAPGAAFVYTGSIRLGGMYIQAGRLLEDMSLDGRLEKERRAFSRNSSFML